MKKTTLIIIVSLIAITGVLWLQNNQKQQPKTEVETNNNQAVVYQKISNNSKQHNVIKGETALELLKKTNSVVTQGEGENAFVTEINSVKTDSNKKEFWAFYINGKTASIGAGSYQLQNNDRIEWKIEKY